MVCGGGRENKVPSVFGGRADGKHNNGENMRNEEDEKQGVTTERLRLERESVRTGRSTAWRQIRAPIQTEIRSMDADWWNQKEISPAGRHRCVSYT